MVLEPLIDHSLHGLAEAAEKADGPVAAFAVLVFAFFENGYEDSFLPFCWKFSSAPRLIEDLKEFLLCIFA